MHDDQLGEMTFRSGGVLRTMDAMSAGIPRSAYEAFIKERQYERVSKGVYLAPDAWKDSLYLLSLRCPQVIFSHETALYLHDLTDREPLQYSVTVKTGYNPSRLSADGIKVYTVKPELYSLGSMPTVTTFAHTIPVYDMERTVCDIIRSRSNIDTQSFQGTLKQYARRRDKNLPRLMEYAKALHVDKLLRTYLEVLL